MQVYISRTGTQEGPFPVEQVRQMLASGDLLPTHHVFHEGLTNWVLASQSPVLAGTPPPQPGGGPPPLAAAPATGRPAHLASAAAAARPHAPR